MKFVGEYKEHLFAANGDLTVSFTVRGGERAEAMETFAKLEKARLDAKETIKYDIEIKKYSPKRSLNANSYFWALANELARVLKVKSEDIYREYVKELGICQTVEINNAAVKTLQYAWADRGLGWIAEVLDKGERRTVVNLYYGSSSYNSKQMAQLIDLVVNDCKLNGIETKSKEDINSLVNEWEKHREKQKK